MPRIFASLAIANLILILGAAGLGFLDPAPNRDRHVLLAVLALLLACLVQVLSFTYLTVSGKVLVQAVHLGRLSPAAVDSSKEIKKRFARCLGIFMLLMVITTATGASAWRADEPSSYHLLAVLLFLTGWVWVQIREYGFICANGLLLEQTLSEYANVRPEPTGTLPQARDATEERFTTNLENKCPTQ